jgi:molybdopterin converting factor small subunit
VSPTVRLPSVLEPAIGNVRRVEVEGETLAAALDDLMASYPSLRAHLFDEGGRLRTHVLCFVDGHSTRLEDSAMTVGDGTEIRFLQAVSGGSLPGPSFPWSAGSR